MKDLDRPWWRLLSGYHWFVVLVASGAWFFDCLDQRLFSQARIPALAAVMHGSASDPNVQAFGKVVTAFFLIGWGIGGIFFGSLGDRYGRARMLTISILIYSLFTGSSFFSQTRFDFTLFRFLTGIGVGGVFGLAVALIAETVPSAARVQSLGLLQVLSTVGNLTAALIKMGLDHLQQAGAIAPGSAWRYAFLVGAVPALLVVLTATRLREPPTWLQLKRAGLLPRDGLLAPYASLLRDQRWRRNLFVGSVLAATGVVGLWGIGEYAIDLQRAVFGQFYKSRLSPKDAKAAVDAAVNLAYFLQMFGAAIGMWLFTQLALTVGRKIAFGLGFVAALLITFFAYWKLQTPADAYWMMPLMGAAQFALFAGYSIYLPELFPGELRSTGTSFCYNLGRFAAAAGSFFSSTLATQVFGGYASPLPLRYSAMTMCALFLIGLAALPFAPETMGRPLPETSDPDPEALPPQSVAAGGAVS